MRILMGLLFFVNIVLQESSTNCQEHPRPEHHRTRHRLHLALDLSDFFENKLPEKIPIQIDSDIGIHVGLNLHRGPHEFTVFGGINTLLSTPREQPHALSAIIGGQFTTEIVRPVRFALQIAASSYWYTTADDQGRAWNPNIHIPIQTGIELILTEWNHSSLSFQGLGGFAPMWVRATWTIAGMCSAALHINL